MESIRQHLGRMVKRPGRRNCTHRATRKHRSLHRSGAAVIAGLAARRLCARVRGSVPANGLPDIDTVEVVADVAMTTGVAGLALLSR